MPVLQAVQLSKQYNGHAALQNLNLSIEKGEIFCLLGQNGAGKTTTINLFLGFISPTSGEAKINGITVRPNDASTKKFIAYIPEVVQLYGNLNGIENLDFFSRLAGFKYSRKELTAFLIKAALQPGAHEKRLSAYSKGMRQKVGIAIALAKKADIILMDEPTSGLDPKASNDFSVILKDLSKDGTAILMATHDIFRAKDIAHRIGIMNEGKMVSVIDPKEISANELEALYLQTI